MADDIPGLGNDGANEGFWRVQIRSERTGRWVKMYGAVKFETNHPNYGPVSGVGVFEGGARPGVALVRVSGGKLDGKVIEVPTSDFEDIKAILPENTPGLEEARRLDALDGIIVNAPTKSETDGELKEQSSFEGATPTEVQQLTRGDIVQQATPEALFGQITDVEQLDSETTRIDVMWSDGNHFAMDLPSSKVVKSWPNGWFFDGTPGVQRRGESSLLDELITSDGFRADFGDIPLSAVDADVISDDHRKAVDTYTRSSLWRSINSYLRGEAEGEEKSEDFLNTISTLDDAITENGEVFEAGRVFRGQRIDADSDWVQIMANLRPGDVMSDDAYLSTSSSSLLAAREFGIGSYGTWERVAEDAMNSDAPGGGGSVFWAIDVPVGSTAFAVPDGMGYAQGAEREVILPRGSRFVIKGIRRVKQNNPNAEPDSPPFYNYFVDAELLPTEQKVVNAPIVEEAVEESRKKTIDDIPINPDLYKKDRYRPASDIAIDIANEDGELDSYQYEAIDTYMGAEYLEVNAVARKYPNLTGEQMLESVDPASVEVVSSWTGETYNLDTERPFDLIKDLDSAFSVSSLANDETVYRGVHAGPELYEQFINLDIGSELVDSAYMSTSTSLQRASDYANRADGAGGFTSPIEGHKPVLFRIKALKGTSAYQNPELERGEDELVLARNTKLKVTSISKTSGGILVIDVETDPSSGGALQGEIETVPLDATTVEETGDWVEVDGVQSKGESDLFAGNLTSEMFVYGGLRNPVGLADSSNFTYEQQRALSNYTGSDYAYINKYLRTGEIDENSDYDEEIMQSELELIDAAIAENGYVEEAAIVFRGMKIKANTKTESGESWSSVLANLQVGDVLEDNGYISTSNSPVVAHHLFGGGERIGNDYTITESSSNHPFHESDTAFWAINVPEGSAALALPVNDENFEITGDEREEEVILPRGSSFRVTGIRRVKQDRSDGKEAYNYYIEADLVPAVKSAENVTEEPEVVDAPTVDEIRPSKSVGESKALDAIFVNGTIDLDVLSSPTEPVDIDSMSPESYNALTEYASFLYRDINGHLRGYGIEPLEWDKGEEDLERRLKEVEKHISNIDEAIEGAGKLDGYTRLFRGVRLTKKLLEVYENLEPGDVLEDKGYMSTTMNPHTAFMFGSYNFGDIGVLIINAPSGSNALAIPTALTGPEQEVLLPRGTKLKVKAVRRTERVESGETLHQYYVEADLVPVSQEELDAPIAQSSPESDVRDLSDFVRVGGSLGSNEGGVYEFGSERIYVKEPQSVLHGENEILASKLYELLGIDAAKVRAGRLADGTDVIYSEWVDSTSDLDERLSDEEYLRKIQEGFGVDAWLANWDVAGLVMDNIVTDGNNNPVRIDAGGALLFRAQGERKGYAFGDDVNELDTLADGTNAQSAKIFGSMTEEQKRKSVERLKDISPAEIYVLVVETISDLGEASKLAQTLVNRRDSALKRFGLSTEEDDVVGIWVDVDGVERIGDAPLFDDDLTDEFVFVSGLEFPLPALDPDSLSDEQVELLIGYTGEDYDPVNTALREADKNGTDVDDPALAGIIEGIDEAFDTAGPTTLDARVFRGLILETPELARMLDNLRPGDEFADAGYISTSNSSKVARNFSMRRDENPSSENASNHSIADKYGTVFMAIDVPAGSKALSIAYLSERKNEEEVLLPHGSRIRVRGLRRVKQKRKDGANYYNYYIEAELVNEPAEVDAPTVDEPVVFDATPGAIFSWMEEGAEPLTNKQRDVLAWYQQAGHININSYLRGFETYESRREVSKNNVDVLDSIMDQSNGTPEDAVLYRGVVANPDLRIEDLVVGSVINDPGYLSTTATKKFVAKWLQSEDSGDGFVLKLLVPKGTKAVVPYSKIEDKDFKHEYEVILDRGANIEVTDIDYENRVVTGTVKISEKPDISEEVNSEPQSNVSPISTIADLVENYEELLSRIEDIDSSSGSKAEKGNVPMRALLEMIGRGGKPEMVDPSVLAGREIFYRGGPAFGIDSLKYSESDRIGLGITGDGYYFSNLTRTAEVYASMGPGGADEGGVVSATWKPTANVYEFTDEAPHYDDKEALQAKAAEFQQEAINVLGISTSNMTEAREEVYMNLFKHKMDALTTMLILKGYDGMSYTFNRGIPGKEEKYTIVFNREALQIADI